MESQPSPPSQDNTSSPPAKQPSLSIRLSASSQKSPRLELDQSGLRNLIVSYNSAIDSKSNSFELHTTEHPPQQLVTRYAYYLIQHLAPYLKLPIIIQPDDKIQIAPPSWKKTHPKD
jgi:hypothetical protein